MKFKAKIVPSGNATAVEVPNTVMEKLNAGSRPLVVVAINGHTWRSRVAAMRGMHLIGISAANRKASAISEGDLVEVLVELDAEPRVVEEPEDVAFALDKRKALRTAFEALPFGLRRKYIVGIEEAKSPETRLRRIAKLVGELEHSAA